MEKNKLLFFSLCYHYVDTCIKEKIMSSNSNILYKNFNGADIKVLLIGSPHSDTKCVWASMLNENSRKKAVEDTDFSLKIDRNSSESSIEYLKEVTKSILSYANSPLKESLETGEIFPDKTFSFQSPLNFPSYDVSLLLKTKDPNYSLKIKFLYVPSKSLENDKICEKHVASLFSESDVILIPLNAVMFTDDEVLNKIGSSTVKLLTDTVSKGLKNSRSKKKKLLLFVPSNCERFCDGADNSLSSVISKMEKNLEPLITLSQLNKCDVVVSPMMVYGNIRFDHLEVSNSPIATNSIGTLYYSYRKNENSEIMNFSPEYCEKPFVAILLHAFSQVKNYHDKRNVFRKFGDGFLSLFGKKPKYLPLIDSIPTLENNLNRDGFSGNYLYNKFSTTKNTKN